MAPFFKGMYEDETLEKFLDRIVRPDTTFLHNCGVVIDKVVQLIFKHSKYSVNHVIKGGSLGKGTGVRDHSDVDLLVVFNNFFLGMGHFVGQIERVISDLEEYFISNQDVDIRITGNTPYTLQFKILCKTDGEWFEVDFLPLPYLVTINTVSSDLSKMKAALKEIYRQMEQQPDLKKNYAKSLAIFQVEFVKEVPSKVKDLIRLMKYWKYTEQVDISSYCLELIVIHVWHQHEKPNKFKMKDLMKDIVQLLSNFGKTAICFDRYYDPFEYISKLNLQPPFVMDPANPFHNVAPKKGWQDYDLVSLQSANYEAQDSGSIIPCIAHGYKVKNKPDIAPDYRDNIKAIEMAGLRLKRKFSQLQDEKSESSSISGTDVIIGAGLCLLFAGAANKLLKKKKK